MPCHETPMDAQAYKGLHQIVSTLTVWLSETLKGSPSGANEGGSVQLCRRTGAGRTYHKAIHAKPM